MILFGVLLASIFISTTNGLEKPYVGVTPSLPKEGENITLECLGNFTHENITSYKWLYNGNIVPTNIKQSWVLQRASRQTSGSYSCRVITSVESKTSESQVVTVLYTLSAPDDVKIVSSTTSSLEISWRVPPSLDQNQSALNYNIYYRTKPFPSDLLTIRAVEKYNLTGLRPGATYEILLSAINRNGEGDIEVIEGKTNDSKSSKVINLKAIGGLSQRIDVSWEKPEHTNGVITSFQICSTQTSFDGLTTLQPVTRCYNGMVSNYTLFGLDKYSSYDIKVSAINLAGNGEPATVTNVITREEVPTNVQNVTVIPWYYNISVSWTTPLHVYGELRGYNVSYTNDGDNFTEVCFNTVLMYCHIDDVSPSQLYTIKVTVANHLFTTSKHINVKTLNVTKPAAYTGLLPPPDTVNLHSFGIRLVTFKGPIKFYDVIVKELGDDADLPNRLPNSYTNEEIRSERNGLYVAGRISDPLKLKKEFIIGDILASTYKRNFPLLPTPTNRRLKQDTYYGVFVRGYADDNIYQSTPWYSPVKTKDTSTPIGGGAITGIVVGSILFIAVIVAILCIIRTKTPKGEKNSEELVQKRPSPFGKQPNIIGGADDPRVPVSLDAFEEHVYQLNANSNYSFSQQYSMISRELDRSYNHSRYQENNHKNRYHNVPSYDESRVVLEVIDNDPHSDYINANYIDGFENREEYIATQGPLPETVFDFWRMAWECDVSTIIMLTKLEEKGRLKCAQYWPDFNATIIRDFVITVTEIQEFPDHIARTFHITRTAQAVEKVVRQYHFIAWPDFGVPEDPSALLCFIRKVNSWKSNSTPAIIHCSAGVGRTGTYITIDTQIKNARKNKEVNIYSNVCDLRSQRCLMVQTEDQYIFIHNAILAYMESDDTEVEASELNEYINLKSQVDNRTAMSGLFEEFIRLAKTDKKGKYIEASRNCNMSKNRYKNICPYDDTRVCLYPYPGLEGSDYINANYIDSYVYKDNFIATQAPLENTASDFWRMTWEQNCMIIVMLVKDTDPGMANVSSYFPHEKVSMKIGYFIIELGCETTYGDYIQREIKITNTEASSSRKVNHFQYTTWPEGGLPENGFGLVELIGQVRKLNDTMENNPIIIHCSGGVGRTGVFIALSNLIERVKSENVVDVYQTVKKMRLQRTAMIQTKDQYEFCYRAVQEFLASFDLYANFSSKDSSDNNDFMGTSPGR